MIATDTSELLEFDELIDRLKGRIQGLSTVHEGLADAKDSLDFALRDFGTVKDEIVSLSETSKGVLKELLDLDPQSLSMTLDERFTALSVLARDGTRTLDGRLSKTLAELGAVKQQADMHTGLIESKLTELDRVLARAFAGLGQQTTTAISTSQRDVTSAIAAFQRSALTEIGALSSNSQRQIESQFTWQQQAATTWSDLERLQQQSIAAAAGIQDAAGELLRLSIAIQGDVARANETVQWVGPMIVSAIESMRQETVRSAASLRQLIFATSVVLFVLFIVRILI